MEEIKKLGVFSKKLKIGSHDHQIPQLGFGCYQVSDEEPFYMALKHGFRHFDSAVFYRNEEKLAKQLLRGMKEFGIQRSEIYITTKIGPSQMGYEKTKASIEQSLKNFQGLDFIDLYLIHFPAAASLKHKDPKNRELRHETWRALEEAVDANLIRNIGVSNFHVSHL